MILSLDSIEKSFGANTVLKKVSLIVNEGEKVALIGANGAGKTTLFRIITGEHTADGGEMALKKGIRLGYLAQNSDLNFGRTVQQELMAVFEHLHRLERDMRELERDMEALAGDELEAAMARYASMLSRFEEGKGYEAESRVRGVMAGLGFAAEEFDLPIGLLSGGQKTRVALAKLLLNAPDLLLLDEPTNHLDIAAISWLEDYFVRDFGKSLIIISHDRYFMDRVATKVVEIEHGASRMYTGNYSTFIQKKMADIEIQMAHYTAQQREIARQEDMIRRWRAIASLHTVPRAKSREKQLAKMERIERPPDAPDAIRIEFKPRRQSGNDVLTTRGASKAFDGRKLFENVNMEIKKGEKVALIGPNGIGKTTLFNIIINSEAGSTLGTNVKIGYYDQALAQLDTSRTVLDEIATAYPRMTTTEIRNALAGFVFVGDDVFAPIDTLSGGERGRVSLLKLMLSDVNFLLLDEPTNHLDLPSKEILEGAINAYTGTVLYISHDRYFINNTADKIYELSPTGTTLYLGDYDYYLEKKTQISPRPIVASIKMEAKDSRAASKAKQADERRIKTAIARMEKEIAEKEERLKQLDEEMAQPDVYNDHITIRQMQDEKAAIEVALEDLYEQWAGVDGL